MRAEYLGLVIIFGSILCLTTSTGLQYGHQQNDLTLHDCVDCINTPDYSKKPHNESENYYLQQTDTSLSTDKPSSSSQSLEREDTTTTSLTNIQDKLNKSFSLIANSSANDLQSRTIISSLIRILSQMKHPINIDDQSSNSNVNQNDVMTNLAVAESADIPITISRMGVSSLDVKNPPQYSRAEPSDWRSSRQHKNSSVRLRTESPSIEPISLNIYSEPLEPSSTATDIDKTRANSDHKKYTYSKYLGSSSPTSDSYAQYKSRNNQLNVDQNKEYLTTKSPKYSRLTNEKINQDDLFDKSLFSIASSSSPGHQKSLPTVASSSKDLASEYANEDSQSATGFANMYNNFKQQEFPNEPDDDTPTPQQVLIVKKPMKQSSNSAPKRYRAAQSISTGRYALPENIRKPIHPITNSDHSYLQAQSQLQHQQLDQDDYDSVQSSRLSANFGDFNEELPRAKSSASFSNGVYLQQIDTKPLTTQFSVQHSQPQQQQATQSYSHLQSAPKVYYTLSSLPHSGYKTSSTTNAQVSTGFSPSFGANLQRDLINQPQTIQITAVPGVGINNSPAVVRVNGLGTTGLANIGNGAFTGNGWLDPLGRQIFMVNSGAERRLDWSWLVWPVAVVVALPLVLSALFVPVFLKSMIILIQILQSLGLVMPVANAIGQQFTQTSANISNSSHHHLTS